MDRFPAIGEPESGGVPLVAYAVEGDADLEILARAVLGGPLHGRLDSDTPGRSEVAVKR